MTEVSLRDYIEMRFDAADKSRHEALVAMEKRLDGMNEFRASLQDQARILMPRSEFDTAHRALTDRIDIITKLVYIGVGVTLAIQMAIGILIVVLRNGAH